MFDHIKLKNGEVGLVGPDYKRCFRRESIVAEIESLELGKRREVKVFQLIMLQVENGQLCAGIHVDPVDIAPFGK